MESNKDEIRNNDGSLLVISSESRKISSQKKDISHSNAGISKIPKVIVIGGGFAGIAAARALTDASFEVILLESRDRIGGRVCTDYSFGFPVDMGASWLHGVCDENPLAHVIGRLGLPLYRTSGDNSVLYDHDLESYALFDTNGNQIPQELVVRVGEVFENILQETVILSEECTNDMSMHHALLAAFERRPDLRLEGLAGKVLQWYMCRLEGWFATDADTISVKFWNKASYQIEMIANMLSSYIVLGRK